MPGSSNGFAHALTLCSRRRGLSIFQALGKLLGFGSQKSTPIRPFPREWTRVLRQHVWQYPHLRGEHRHRLEDVVEHMVHHRRWTGGNGFDVTDEMRVAIAGNVALMTLGLEEPYYFPYVPDIILYAKPFFVSRQQASEWSTDPVFGTMVDSPRYGEAWHRGPIVLAWESIVHPYDDEGYRFNVVIHEFTHHLDGLDGDMSGTPPMVDVDMEREWYRVTELDYLELLGRADRDEPTLLSHYGASNRAEFFAVATECFFDQPHDLREKHRHLYEVLAKYFRQSPANYVPRSAQPAHREPGAPKRSWRSQAKLRDAVAADPFSRGLAELDDGEPEKAIAALTTAINNDANDSEAYAARALAYLELGDLDHALADANQTLVLDEEDLDALTVRGCVRVLTEDTRCGIDDLRAVCLSADSAIARAHLGLGYARLKQTKRAIHELTLAITIDPADPQPYRWRAEAYRRQGDKLLAERDEEKALRLSPQDMD